MHFAHRAGETFLLQARWPLPPIDPFHDVTLDICVVGIMKLKIKELSFALLALCFARVLREAVAGFVEEYVLS